MKYKLCNPALLAVAAAVCIGTSRGAAQEPADRRLPGGQALVYRAAEKTAEHVTIESRLRVRTDLLGQPLVGSGGYAQLRSSSGLLLRMELAIQAGEQATSVKQVSDGRDLWEHWRIGETERVNHVDLRRVQAAIEQNAAVLDMGSTSANLASGGLPKLLSQLDKNFDFSRAEVRAGKIGEVPVWIASGVWKPERLATAAPQAAKGKEIAMEALPAHLPHQVELLIGQQDWFPYRVTYYRWHRQDGSRALTPVVTTEFFEVAMDDALDPTQFHYQQPNHVSVTDRTEAFIESLGIPASRVTARPRPEPTR